MNKKLTKKENEILQLLLSGNDIATIAKILANARQTIKNHNVKIFAKLQVASHIELLQKKDSIINGLKIELPEETEKNIFHNVIVKVAIPSTTEKSIVISDNEHKERATFLAKKMSSMFGGVTEYNNCNGQWLNDNNILISEKIIMLESFASEYNHNEFAQLIAKLRDTWKQDSRIVMVYRSAMAYFI